MMKEGRLLWQRLLLLAATKGAEERVVECSAEIYVVVAIFVITVGSSLQFGLQHRYVWYTRGYILSTDSNDDLQ
jgi:hypothetical protein